ncbi:hypothetical protein BH11ARM2_BH11ARM2_30320 [soil metagenome]
MELDELRMQWAAQSRKLDETTRLNERLLAVRQLDRARATLLWPKIGASLEIALSVLVLLWIGGFVFDHRAQPAFLIPGLAVHLYSILILAAEIQTLIALNADFSRPVVEIKGSLARARVWQIRSTQAIFLTAPLIWTPLLIVLIKGIVGLDAYRMFGTPWLLANLIFGIAFIPATLGIVRLLRKNGKLSRLMAGLADTLTGEGVKKAASELDRLSEFEAG